MTLFDFRYEAEESPKRKHFWRRRYAGFEERDGEPVGKCPVGLPTDVPERMLNSGIPYFNPRAPGSFPDRLYIVYEGVVYRAMPTRVGISYHAFPEFGERLRQLPRSTKAAILNRATELGCRSEVERWMEA